MSNQLRTADEENGNKLKKSYTKIYRSSEAKSASKTNNKLGIGTNMRREERFEDYMHGDKEFRPSRFNFV